MKKITNKGFTLVELMLVVVILSILGAIGFVSFTGYLSQVRDGNRIAQLTGIEQALKIYSAEKDLPLPEGYVSVTHSGTTVGYQGNIGDVILTKIGYNDGGQDPLDKKPYFYYLSDNRKDFQILGYLENPLSESYALSTNNTIASSLYSNRYPKVNGRNLGIMINSDNTPINEILTITGSLDISTTTDTYKALLNDDRFIEGDYTVLAGLKNIVNIGEIKSSCKKLLDANGRLKGKDGPYLISPSGTGAYTIHCDMTTDGGGWTFATMNSSGLNIFHATNNPPYIGDISDTTTRGSVENVWLDSGDKDIMLVCETDATGDDIAITNYETPMIIYDFKKSDISNLTTDSKGTGTFSSEELTMKWNGNTDTVATNWSNEYGGNAYGLDSATSGRTLVHFWSGNRIAVDYPGSSDADGPAYNYYANQHRTKAFNSSNYCMVALRDS